MILVTKMKRKARRERYAENVKRLYQRVEWKGKKKERIKTKTVFDKSW